MKSWTGNAAVGLAMVVLAACGTTSSSENRRSLFIDQVEPHAERESVMDSLIGSGWCVARERDHAVKLYWCSRDPAMFLSLQFAGAELVEASLAVPTFRAPATPEEAESLTEVKRYRTNQLFAELGVELRERYGAPRRSGDSFAEWTPSSAFAVTLHKDRMYVIETYRFPSSTVGRPTLVTASEHAVRP